MDQKRKKKEVNGIKLKNLLKGREKYDVLRRLKKGEKSKAAITRTELLLPETSGTLERTSGSTAFISQNEIRSAVDITAATKSFDLKLNQFGPYKFRYSQDGRNVVLGGRLGHLAMFDWQTKKLMFEVNVMESLYDVVFLHQHKMVATAQKKWTYVYDQKGVELHCLKQMNEPISLEFLPFHFLLCSGADNGFLTWLDITLGKELLKVPTYRGRLNLMCQNPSNAVIHCAHGSGVVSLWTPNSKKPALEVFCHAQPLKSLAVDPFGRYMATSSNDKTVKIWDTRNLSTEIASHRLPEVAYNLAFSQKGLLAASLKNRIEIYRNIHESDAEVYMRHQCSSIQKMQFCPYEDTLGVSGYEGFSSLLIPGSGDPNFDGMEVNPYAGKQALREGEIKSLLGKIHYSQITLDSGTIMEVDAKTAQEKFEATVAQGYVKVPKLNFQPRHRMKGKSSAKAKAARVKIENDRQRSRFFKDRRSKFDQKKKNQKTDPAKKGSVLDRFKK